MDFNTSTEQRLIVETVRAFVECELGRASIETILAVSACAEAHAARLEELDINPLLVLPEGQGAVAVDALIRLREEREE